MGLSYSAAIAIPLLAALIGIAGAALGLWLTGLRQRIQMMVPLSAGVLLGVALFGLLPELAEQAGWVPSGLLFVAGYGLLIAINKFAYPVCPTCAHNHDHAACSTELHGFAAPLVAASALHAFLDGWAIATVQSAAPLGLRVAVPLAVTLHKLPEGIALGGILRASMGSRAAAMGWCTLAEGATVAGGILGLAMAPHLGTQWIFYPLGVTAGWLFYLGYHAVHEEWKRRGARAAFVSAAIGIAGAAIIQRGAEALFQ
ncbi:MAG TPA: ZIP family metal transporter [Bryobacteraceae bacterium]|jgi:zinc transporter ZupT|nr:ZIP family metal transporter [Bryobacteraceae bacterium]